MQIEVLYLIKQITKRRCPLLQEKHLLFEVLAGYQLIFITHDLGAISKVADRILVMNSGRIVDSGSFEHIRNHSQDPYTRFLIEKRSAANSHNYYVIIHHFLPLLFTLLRKYLFHSSLPDKANHQIS